MKKSLSANERALQIELVRARAALERQSLARNVRGLSESLTPAAIMRGFFPRLSSKRPSDWIFQAFALSRQYPLLASSVSALLSGIGGIGKRRRLWRIGAGLLLSWQIARSMKARSD